VNKLIYVERDPVEAALSHTNREDDASEAKLEAGVLWWKSLRDQFEKHPTDRRHLVRFEDIFDGGTGWIRTLAEFLEIRTSDNAIQRCGELLDEARNVLTRAPLTDAPDTYRKKFPDKAGTVDLLLARH